MASRKLAGTEKLTGNYYTISIFIVSSNHFLWPSISPRRNLRNSAQLLSFSSQLPIKHITTANDMFSAIKLIIFVIARNDHIGDFSIFIAAARTGRIKWVKCNLFAVVEWKIGFRGKQVAFNFCDSSYRGRL